MLGVIGPANVRHREAPGATWDGLRGYSTLRRFSLPSPSIPQPIALLELCIRLENRKLSSLFSLHFSPTSLKRFSSKCSGRDL